MQRRWHGILVMASVLLAVQATRAEDEPGTAVELPSPEVVVHVDMRVVEMPPCRAAGYLGHLHRAKTPVIRPLTLEEARALLEAARRRHDMRVREWVRATTRMEQAVILDNTVRETYVQDYDVEVTMGGASVADPVIGTLIEGVTLEASARLRKRDMVLHLRGTWGSVIRPIPLFSTNLTVAPQAQEVTIQLPELRLQQVDEELAFVGEGWWLIATRVPFTDERGRGTARVALVHARRALYGHPQLGTANGER